jgi:hypothetical protein
VRAAFINHVTILIRDYEAVGITATTGFAVNSGLRNYLLKRAF